MLWYKGWLETRFKLAVVAGLLFVFFLFLHTHPAGTASHGARAGQAADATPLDTILTIWIFVLLAGAGITTQATFQAAKGIHGSTLFTLALPASRLRLVLVRAGLGWLESAAAVALMYYGTWLMSPPMRATTPLIAMGEYAGTVLVCGSVLYFLSVFLAAFLDDLWRIWGTLIAFFAWLWLSAYAKLPPFADVFRAMGKGSVLVAHAVPWSAMGFSVGLSALLFFAALTVARAREY